jgi:hypothetical protein
MLCFSRAVVVHSGAHHRARVMEGHPCAKTGPGCDEEHAGKGVAYARRFETVELYRSVVASVTDQT